MPLIQTSPPKDPVSIRYGADTHAELDESLKMAEEDYDRLVNEGYPSVRIVISNHWASEGVWVEAGNTERPLSEDDYLHKSNK